MTALSQLEQQVLETLLRGDHPTLVVLRSQLPHTTVISREHTGAGFFTQLAVAPEAPRLSPPASFSFGDVGAAIPGLQLGACFLLFIEDGALSMLEGYSYDEPWPSMIDSFDLAYLKPHRDYSGIPGFPSEGRMTP